MKKFVAILSLVAFSFLAVGCHSSQVIDGTRYDPIGVYHKLAEPEAEAPNVRYDVSWGNVVWSVIFCETLVVPIVLVGWYLWEPAGPNNNDYQPPPRS